MSIYIPQDKRQALTPLIDALVEEYAPVVEEILSSSQVERRQAIGKLLQPIFRFMHSTRKGRFGPSGRHEKWVPAFRMEGLSEAETGIHTLLRERVEAGEQIGGQCAFCIYCFIVNLLKLTEGPARFKRHQLCEELIAGFGEDTSCGFFAGMAGQVRHELTIRYLAPYREEKRMEFGDLP